MILRTAEFLMGKGVNLMRAGAFKPRSSPYSFQGMGLEGLKILEKARQRTGIGIVTELMDTENADAVEAAADIIQIGTRNMQNFALLRRVSKARKPVLLKRGLSATLEEWLMAAEYVMAGGNYNVILCERGVRTFSDHSRNTLDLSVIPPVKQLSHLPILVDPSHGTGKRDYVPAMALAALAAGADGLLAGGPSRSRPGPVGRCAVAELRGVREAADVAETTGGAAGADAELTAKGGWHALGYSEGRAVSAARPSEYLRACHPASPGWWDRWTCLPPPHPLSNLAGSFFWQRKWNMYKD